jgi:nitrate/nitrite-specific signal transduction histidine kinase
MFLFACSAKPQKPKNKIENKFYGKAFDFREKEESDSAFLYFNKAKDLFFQQKDSLGAGKCLLNMAIIATARGDYFGGEELSLNALACFNKNQKDQHVFIRSNYNNLGIATFSLNDYDNSIRLYDSAILYSKYDSLNLRVTLNNKARTYQAMKRYGASLRIYNQILNQTQKNPKEYARSLTNISRTKWLQNPNYNPLADYLKALHIRQKENDLLGQNSSYSRLSEYYNDKAPDSALSYARKMYAVAKQINSPDDETNALQRLITLAPPAESKKYFRIYQKLDDSLETVRNAAKNQFALIKYETEKNKADNLILQKDNEKKRYQMILLISGSLFIAVAGILWYKRRKQLLALQAETAIRESQLRTSKRVHDVVANGLYRVMTEIENQQEVNKAHVLDKIEDLYEKSRDISYEKPEASSPDFDRKISALLQSFATENTKILIAGNSADLWEKASLNARYEVEHILQELMVNMKKHSQASHVVLRFEYIESQINIYYTDNGVGLAKDNKFNNGLRNTGNRIEGINGAIIFERNGENGLKIQISFPAS